MTSKKQTRPLLAVKHVIPPPRRGVVVRERLERQLRLAETRLTVVVAPAGWGKTSLLSRWACDPDAEHRIAWVSLDENDDEPVRFWTYVLTALREVSDELGTDPLRALDAVDLPAVDLALPMLLNELASTTQRHVLVLDDYHVLADPRIHEAVEFLVSYLPPSLRLVIAGRADPPLPLARLRARGDLTELRAPQLRFHPGEAVELISAVSGHDLDPATAAAVCERTEGWAAGLQLTALALRVDPAKVHGDDRHVLDYFAAEVLPGLDARQRDLLVRAAPLERLSGSLCDAALQVTGSAEVLAELVRADLFVAALDEQQQWYRCHQLLRDALARQATADPGDVLDRAAAWFSAQDRIDDAVRHLLRAGRAGAAADLLQNSAETWFFPRGAAATYLQLGDQLPDAVAGPVLALSLAQAATLSGQQDRTIHWLDVAEARITPETVVPGWHSARAMALCLRATFGLPEVETARSVEIARQAIELETENGAGGHPSAHTALGAALSREGRFDEGSAVLLDLWRRPERFSWPPWTTLLLAGALSLSLVELGDGPGCDRVLREIGPLAQTVERDHRETTAPGLASLRLAEGRRRYQDGDVEAAAVLLRRAVALAELHPRRQLVIIGLVYLADAELACGDRAAARTALARAREIGDDEPTSAFVAGLVEQAETRLGRAGTRTAVRSGALIEELTDRELSILRALQGPASQREIGAALFLSINTVKAYTKSLYRKLAVASRQDAVMTARDLGLI